MKDRSSHRHGELIRGVFELLWNRPEGLPAEEIMLLLPSIIKLSESETGISSGLNMPVYEWMVRLVAVSLVKAGWLAKTDSGRWIITQSGKEASKRYSSVQDFYTEALRLSEGHGLENPELLIFLEHTQEKAWKLIRQFLQDRNITEFRKLLSDLLEAMNFHVQWIAPAEKTRGQIDLIAHTHPLGIGEYRILVQIKHTGQVVTVEGIKSFLSVLGRDDYGMLISTSGFTHEAIDEMGSSSDYKKISAVTLEKFFHLWVKNYKSLSRDAHMRFPLRTIHLLSPPD